VVSLAHDASKGALQLPFQTGDGAPWALEIPTDWKHPLAGVSIMQAYPQFLGFARDSSGLTNPPRSLAERGHEIAMVLPARHDLAPDPVAGITFYPYRYAPSRSLTVFGYAEALRADVAVRRSTYLVAPLAVASGAAKMAALARRGGFDVIHAHWVVPNGAMALPARWFSGLPLVVSLHGSDVFLSERGSSFRRAAAMAFRRAAAVTACSDDLAE
ncbi:MAG: glycosyltransferase, partial [bacterium]|nr:glycosyltransferase [bacterium]